MIKRALVPLAKVLVSASLVAFILSRIGVGRLRQSLAQADFTWILLAIAIFTFSNILGALQWNLLLRARGIRFSVLKAVSFYFVGLFLNNFLVGYVGGDAFRAYDASRASGNSSGAISAVFVDRLVGFTVLTSMAVCACVFWYDLAVSRASLGVLGLLLMGWLVALLFFFNRRIAQKLVFVFKRLLPLRLQARMREIYDAVNSYRHNKSLLLTVFCLSLVIQFLRILVHYVAALAVGIRVELVYFVIFIPVVALAASLPISIGGIGVREQSGVVLFSRIGVLEPSVVAMEFLAYLVGVIATIPGGLVFVLRKEHRAVQEVRALEAKPTV